MVPSRSVHSGMGVAEEVRTATPRSPEANLILLEQLLGRRSEHTHIETKPSVDTASINPTPFFAQTNAHRLKHPETQMSDFVAIKTDATCESDFETTPPATSEPPNAPRPRVASDAWSTRDRFARRPATLLSSKGIARRSLNTPRIHSSSLITVLR